MGTYYRCFWPVPILCHFITLNMSEYTSSTLDVFKSMLSYSKYVSVHIIFHYTLLTLGSSLPRSYILLNSSNYTPLNLLYSSKPFMKLTPLTHIQLHTFGTHIHVHSTSLNHVCCKIFKNIYSWDIWLKWENVCTLKHNAIWLLLAACPHVGLLYH